MTFELINKRKQKEPTGVSMTIFNSSLIKSGKWFMPQSCLESLLLHVHKDLLDALDLIDIANKFVGINQRRRNTFGVFTSSDLLCKERVFVRHSSTQTDEKNI